MTELLTGKNAIIYGGGGSIGGAAARTFAREGATVFLAGRTRESLERVAADVAAAVGRAEVAVVDAHADAVAAQAGSIDVSFNAGVAGTLTRESIAEVSGAAEVDVDAIAAGIAQMAMLRRQPELQQVADTAAFLASDRAGAITSGIVNATCGLVAG